MVEIDSIQLLIPNLFCDVNASFNKWIYTNTRIIEGISKRHGLNDAKYLGCHF